MGNYSELIREIVDSTNWSYTAFYDRLEEIIGYEIPNFLGFQLLYPCNQKPRHTEIKYYLKTDGVALYG